MKLMVRMEKAKARYEDPTQGSLFGGGEAPKRPSGGGKGKLVPKKVSVSRGGKNFQQTVWVKPGGGAQASRSTGGEQSSDGFKLIEAANEYAAHVARGDRKEYLKRLNAQTQLPHRIREYRAENRNMPAKKDAFLSGIEKMLKEAKDMQPEVVESRDKLKPLGEVEITSVGQENVYFEDKMGWKYFIKTDDIGMRPDDFSEGKFDMGTLDVNVSGSADDKGRKDITLYDLGKMIAKQRGGVHVPMDRDDKKLFAKWYGITEKELDSAMFVASSEWKENNKKVKIKDVPEDEAPSYNSGSETPYGASPTNAKEYTDYLSQMLGDVPSRKKALFDAQVEMSGLPKEEQLKALKEMGVDVDSGNVLDQFKSKLESMQRKARAGKESDQKSFVKDQDKKRQDAKLQGIVKQAEKTAEKSGSSSGADHGLKLAKKYGPMSLDEFGGLLARMSDEELKSEFKSMEAAESAAEIETAALLDYLMAGVKAELDVRINLRKQQSKDSFDPQSFLIRVADSWERLRKLDVYRLINESGENNTEAMASTIKKKRPDLKGEVDAVMEELS